MDSYWSWGGRSDRQKGECQGWAETSPKRPRSTKAYARPFTQTPSSKVLKPTIWEACTQKKAQSDQSMLIIFCQWSSYLYIVQSQNDFLREWVPRRESFLGHLLDMEAHPSNGLCNQCKTNEGIFRCEDCLGHLVCCRTCFMTAHKFLPYHRIQRWNGNYFARSTLYNQGHIVHLGHHGHACPANNTEESEWLEADGAEDFMDGVDLLRGDEDRTKSRPSADGVVDIVHTTGIFWHNVRWCCCLGAPDKPVQLFQMHLFPASLERPETAFTFDVLDYFHIDSMECKTSASSFAKKVCCLTNNAFPHMVMVGASILRHHLCVDLIFRIGRGNCSECPVSGGISCGRNVLALDMTLTDSQKTGT